MNTARLRDSNLDLLRALAILMVVIYHVTQRWITPLPEIYSITKYGEFGVDLFFVLSGWLIGRLLWHEEIKFGNIEVVRFLGRRMLRTVPPYFVALAIYFAGVHFIKGQEFEWRYLFFLQNYLTSIPFFLISWSLCVEEQFYLLMPFLVIAIARHAPRPALMMPLLAALPMVFRAFYWTPEIEANTEIFGFYQTASHLRFEGLMLGVWAAFLIEGRQRAWEKTRQLAPLALAVSLGAIVLLQWAPPQFRYIFLYTAVAVTFISLLVMIVARPALPLAGSRAVLWIAITSYSVYLTHAIALDVALRIARRLGCHPMVYLIILTVLIIALGGLFYIFIERTSMKIRCHFLPNRKAA